MLLQQLLPSPFPLEIVYVILLCISPNPVILHLAPQEHYIRGQVCVPKTLLLPV